MTCKTAYATYHSMPPASIATNVSKSLDVQGIESTKISLNCVVVNLLTQDCQFLFTELSRSLVLYTLYRSCLVKQLMLVSHMCPCRHYSAAITGANYVYHVHLCKAGEQVFCTIANSHVGAAPSQLE